MSKYNLGIVKTSLLGNLNETTAIKEFVGLLKESNLLRLELSIFDNLEKKTITNEDLAIKYIDENIRLLKEGGFTKEVFDAENKKFLPIIEGIQFSGTDKKELFEKIHVMLYESLPGKKTTNVNRLYESFSYVLDHIKNPKIEALVEKVDVPTDLPMDEFIITKSIDEFNNKYSELLSEEEMLVLKSVISESRLVKETTFNQIRENTVSFLSDFLTELNHNENVDIHEQRDVENYIQKTNDSIDAIKKMVFNESTYMVDVTKLIDFKK